MLSSATLLARFRSLSGQTPNAESTGLAASTPQGPPLTESETLIGFFQQFRPDGINAQGESLTGLFEGVSAGLDLEQELESRLERLFEIAGDDRRPQGGRDAYFIARQRPPIQAEQVEHFAETFLRELEAFAGFVGDQETAERLDPFPNIRVLEGLPPKQPKRPEDRSPLLDGLQVSAAKMTVSDTMLKKLNPEMADLIPLLQPAYYFTTCDPFVRDYLMWPFFQAGFKETCPVKDPFAPYFRLWEHGIKWRVISANQVDWYIPRPLDS